MKRFGLLWWLVVFVGSLLLLSAALEVMRPSLEKAAVLPTPQRGSYQMHTEKLKDGTFCVIVISQGRPAVSCDFDCRALNGKEDVCK